MFVESNHVFASVRFPLQPNGYGSESQAQLIVERFSDSDVSISFDKSKSDKIRTSWSSKTYEHWYHTKRATRLAPCLVCGHRSCVHQINWTSQEWLNQSDQKCQPSKCKELNKMRQYLQRRAKKSLREHRETWSLGSVMTGCLGRYSGGGRQTGKWWKVL